MKSKRQQLDEGLKLSRAFMQKYGYQRLSRNVIALWCGCSTQNIEQIERRALRKLRLYGVFKIADLNYHCRLAANYYKIEL